MQLVLSTHLFVEHRLTTAWLERVLDAGFRPLRFFARASIWTIAIMRRSASWGIGSAIRDLKLHSLHSPMYNDDVWGRFGAESVIDITEPFKGKRMSMVDEIKRAIEIAETVPFRYLIQHLGVSGQELDERRFEAGFSSLEEIKVFASQRGVEVLLENTPNRLASAERLNSFLTQTHLNLGYCFDIGHANMTGHCRSNSN